MEEMKMICPRQGECGPVNIPSSCPLCACAPTQFKLSNGALLPIKNQKCSNCELSCHFWERIASALAAQERLATGNPTPEEYQNICHNLDCKDHKAFIQGCRKEWKKLGIPDMIDELSRENQDLRMELLRSERQRLIIDSQLSDMVELINLLKQQIEGLEEDISWYRHDKA